MERFLTSNEIHAICTSLDSSAERIDAWARELLMRLSPKEGDEALTSAQDAILAQALELSMQYTHRARAMRNLSFFLRRNPVVAFCDTILPEQL